MQIVERGGRWLIARSLGCCGDSELFEFWVAGDRWIPASSMATGFANREEVESRLPECAVPKDCVISDEVRMLVGFPA